MVKKVDETLKNGEKKLTANFLMSNSRGAQNVAQDGFIGMKF